MDNNPFSIERIQAALVKGPFVAHAKIGPKFYNEEPTAFIGQIQPHPDLPVYGWTRAQQKPCMIGAAYQDIIVCGVQKYKNVEHIYYLLAEEMHTDWSSGITEHKKTSDKVYAASVKKFSDSVYNMLPPAQ